MLVNKKKLTHHKSANCYVTVEDDGTINLISYDTLVVHATPYTLNEYVLFCTGTYSQTTRKHISWFLKEYFGDISYYDMKKCYENSVGICGKRKHAKFW